MADYDPEVPVMAGSPHAEGAVDGSTDEVTGVV